VYKPTLAQAPKPRPLSFREAARAVGDATGHFIAIVFAREVTERFSITHRLASRAAEFTCGRKLLNLVDESAVDHRANAIFDPSMQFFARASQHENAALIRWPAILKLQLLMTDRLTRRSIDFDRANEPARVVRMDVRRRNRIDLR